MQLEPATASHRVLGFALAFALVGVVEAIVTLATGGARDGGVATTALAIVTLWGLTGALVGALAHAVLRIALGERAGAGVWEPIGGRVLAAWREPDPARDRRRVAWVAALALGVGLYVGASFALLRWLIDNKHGAGLIATTFLWLQLGIVAAAGVTGITVARIVAATQRPRWLRLRTLALASAPLAVGLVVLGAWLNRRLLRTLDGDAVALFALALVVAVAGVRRLRRRRVRARWVAAAVVGALAAHFGAVQVGATRRAVAMEALVARHVFGTLVRWSDFDADIAPTFPTGADCAPFDPAIHPLAPEIPGNGVDEDCDGRDEVTVAALPKRVAAPASPPKTRPSIVLVTIDSLRADHLGLYGYDRPTSPKLDARARRAVVFERAYAADSGTGPSLWSLMTGKTPFQAKLVEGLGFPPPLGDEEKPLAELLKAAGYRTEALLCGSVFALEHWNLRRGFDLYEASCRRVRAAQARPVTDLALERLRALRGGKQPFFLWVHYFDPHQPYHDHPDLKLAGDDDPMGRYDEEIAYTDRHLERLLAAIPRDVYVAVTADHGENFDEHGRDPHARTLYREVTHVPLLVWGPRVKARRVAEPVASNDLYPTFLQLAGVPVPDESTMVGQAEVLFGAAPDPARPVFQENGYARPRRHVKGVVRGRHHLLHDVTLGVYELFDLADDPGETRNLSGQGLPEEAELRALLRAFATTTRTPSNLAR